MCKVLVEHTCCDTEFPADRLQLLADFVQLLCRKESASNPGRVCFYHSNNVLDRAPSQCEPGEDSSKPSIGGCAERISAVVDIEQNSVGPFDQDIRPRVLGRSEKRYLVNDERLQFSAVKL